MIFSRRFLSILILAGAVWGTQSSSVLQPNIAVIDFTGDQTVTADQLSFITGTMASELVSTNVFTVLDRGRMDYILEEQGFQQSGACNSQECRVQIGQLLGVDFLVSGTLVKFGPAYMMRVDYLDVQTGQILQSVNLQKEGELYQIVKGLCHDGVQMLVNSLDSHSGHQISADALPKVENRPMSFKRKVALALWGTSLAAAGVGGYFNYRGVGYREDYQNTKDTSEVRDYASKMDDMERDRNVSYGISIGTALVGLVLWFLPEGK
ncbi:MAG TPA: CsgG/HfaB family protein [Fibrobacteraceae bacterium]|nr:CsgG/HfaB family protein [Fibrobacteraceae bacterium]